MSEPSIDERAPAFIAERVYRTTRLLISRSDRDNFMKAMRAAIAAIVVVERLDPIFASKIYELAEHKLLNET